ncbi:MAG: ATP-grasp domain-containing protein [Eubacteriales bacterium]|nr:ATP-grasp domain-containing protein [Eubacteriales bacterium]
MNILLTSAGRRSYLVEYFKEALSGSGRVYAANAVWSPALLAADEGILTPLIYSEEYIPFLKKVCEEKEIGLLVPLFDIDLPVLARHQAQFEAMSVKMAVSSAETLLFCNDKYHMSLKLWKLGIRCPETCISVDDALLKIDALAMSYPVIVKPRLGMGSLSVCEAYNKAELRALYGLCERQISQSYLKYEAAACPKECVVIQEKLSGNEYGLDVINDLSGNYVTTIVRRKLAMRAGETDEALTLGKDDAEYKVLSELGEKISVGFSHVGNMDVDVIMDPGNMRPYVIDMNARFGGGYPFSHLAGADLPRAYVAWAKGDTPDPEWFRVRPHVHGYKDMVLRAFPERRADGTEK